jgi:hypothetical protein
MAIVEHSLSPIASNWFTARVEYDGWGLAEFDDPAGRIEGPVKASFDEHGEARIEMEVKEHQSSEELDFGLWQLLIGGRPTEVQGQKTLGFGGQHNACRRLVVTSSEGTFYADSDIHFGFRSEETMTVEFFPLHSRFDVVNAAAPCYWVLPLSNLISGFQQSHPGLDRHPLRIYQTPVVPVGLSGTDLLNAGLVANRHNRLIVFEFGSQPAFIEPLADYQDRKGDLEKGRERNLITSVMVGDVGGRLVDFSDLANWPPLNFLPLLGIVTGSEIGSPWIELRDAQGKLVRRIHYQLGRPAYARGHSAINENVHGATGYLLTKAQSSPYWGAPLLRSVAKHAVHGGLYGETIEDRMVHICRGLEALCWQLGLSRLNLIAGLKPAHQDTVRKAIAGAVTRLISLAGLASAAGELDQQRSLQKIAGRLSNAANIDVDFGLSVCELLKSYGIPDADIMDAHYRAHPRSDGIPTWSALLSRYRGIAIHEGHFDVLSGRDDLGDILTVVFHLHDILVRLIFKMLGYDGSYQPTVVKMTADMPVDWVTANLPASRLGNS